MLFKIDDCNLLPMIGNLYAIIVASLVKQGRYSYSFKVKLLKKYLKLLPASLNEFNFSFVPYDEHLITELSRSVWENLGLCRVYRPHCIRPVLTASIKILPYRPPVRLIRTTYKHTCSPQCLTRDVCFRTG